MTDKPLPSIIALCGYPGAGKNEVARLLNKHYEYLAVDDGAPIRRAAMLWFGWDWKTVSTAVGKASVRDARGKPELVRTVLQDIGIFMEQRFGDDIMPRIALGEMKKFHTKIVFPSCRRRQGWFWRDNGGIVVEVVRPGKEWDGTESERYDQSAVQYTMHNDGGLDDLESKVFTMMELIRITTATAKV